MRAKRREGNIWRNMQMSSLLKPTVIYSCEPELIGYHCIRSENLQREWMVCREIIISGEGILFIRAKLFPEFMWEKAACVHAEINGGWERDEKSSIRHASYMLYPNLNHRPAHLSFAFHGWPHHKSSDWQPWTHSRISHHPTINAKLSTLFYAHGGFSNGYPTTWTAVGHKLKLVTQTIDGSSLTPGLQTSPWLPAADAEPIRAEDEPGAWVWSGDTVRSWWGDKGSDHGGSCDWGTGKIVNHDHPPFPLPPRSFSLAGKWPHPPSIVAVEVWWEGPDNHSKYEEENINIVTKEGSTGK